MDQNILNFLPEREQSEVYKLLSPHVLMTEPVAADFLNGKLFAHLLIKEICHRQAAPRGSSQLFSSPVCHCCFASVNILKFDAVHWLMFLLAALARFGQCVLYCLLWLTGQRETALIRYFSQSGSKPVKGVWGLGGKNEGRRNPKGFWQSLVL